MSLLFMDGFGHTDIASAKNSSFAIILKWDSGFFSSNFFPLQSEGRYSPGALQVKGTGGGGWIIKLVPESTELIMGFSFKPTDNFSTLVMFHHDQGTTLTPPRLQLEGVQGGSGGITVFTPGGAACSKTSVLPDDTWVHVEWRIKLGVTDGEIEVRINGVVECLETGVNTVGNPTDRKLIGIRIQATHNSQLHYIDDLYLLDKTGTTSNDFLHDGVKTPRISFLKPKANGGINTFGVVNQAGDTAHWQAVDEPLANRAIDFVSSRTPGNSEDYVMETFAEASITPGTIHCIQVVNAAIKSGNSPLSYISEMVIAGTRYTSGVVSTATLNDHCSLYPRGSDPSDDTDWTQVKVENVGSAFSVVDPE